MKDKIKKWSSGTVLTIIVGLLINAIWDLIKSYTGGIFLFFVRITTLGFERLNDNIYKEIARNFHESSSLALYVLVTSLSVYITAAGIVISRKLLKRYNKDQLSVASEEKKPKSKNFLFRFIDMTTIPILAIFIIVTGFDLVRETYINKAILYYNQLLTIVAPDLDNKQLLILNSNFSQINNSKDYQKVMEELESIAKSKNYRLPKKPAVL